MVVSMASDGYQWLQEDAVRKTRLQIQLDADDLDWVDKQCLGHDRKRPYVVARAIRFARDNGLDLSAGAARETAAAMAGQGRA